MDGTWQASRLFSDRVLAAAESHPEFLNGFQESYAVWHMEPAPGYARSAMTITLAHHAALTDCIAVGMNLDQAMEAIAIDSLVDALATRPAHEFFVGLPADLDAQDAQLVYDLKVLANSHMGQRHHQWMRHTAQARAALRHYAAVARTPGDACD